MTENAKVWLAEVSTSSEFQKPIRDVRFADALEGKPTKEAANEVMDRHVATIARYRAGEKLTVEELGTEFALIPKFKKPNGPFPIMNFTSSRLVVTSEARALLEGLDPGPLSFHPITALNSARTKPLWDGAELHVMQVLECRRETVIEESGALSPISGKCLDGTGLQFVGPTDGPDPIVVRPPAAGASEMWVDDRLRGALFLTDRIAHAIRAAKMTRHWGLTECRLAATS